MNTAPTDDADETTRLIVNADDFGNSPAVNRSIQECARRGVVTSTTVMVNLAWAEEITELLAACPHVGVGLHLNLTEGVPVMPSREVRSLVDEDGRFWTTREFLRRAWLGRLEHDDLLAEAGAQLRRLLSLTNGVTHLDSHKHIHTRSPAVLQALLGVGAEYGVRRIRGGRRVFVSSEAKNHHSGTMAMNHYRTSLRSVSGWALARRQRSKLRSAGYSSPDWILTPTPPIPTIVADDAAAQWSLVLERAPTGTLEAIFHPGGGERYQGQEELLCHPQLRAAIGQFGIRLTHYGHL